jgi:hypothetical protein
MLAWAAGQDFSIIGAKTLYREVSMDTVERKICDRCSNRAIYPAAAKLRTDARRFSAIHGHRRQLNGKK